MLILDEFCNFSDFFQKVQSVLRNVVRRAIAARRPDADRRPAVVTTAAVTTTPVKSLS